MSTSNNSYDSPTPLNLGDVSDWQIGIVSTEWNTDIISNLIEGAHSQLLLNGIDKENIQSIIVPGSYELPFGARKLIQLFPEVSSVICIGCVIKGDTDHDRYINRSVSAALMSLGLASSIPHIFGVLTVNTEEQALERSGGKHGNRGIEWASTALKMADLNRKKRSTKIGF